MGRRHSDVDQREIRFQLTHELDQLDAVAGATDDLETRALQQARETLAQQNVVVGHDDPISSLGNPGSSAARDPSPVRHQA
jgi:hypothetical protein